MCGARPCRRPDVVPHGSRGGRARSTPEAESGQNHESILPKVVIEGEGSPDTSMFHHGKARAIDHAVSLVLTVLENGPGAVLLVVLNRADGQPGGRNGAPTKPYRRSMTGALTQIGGAFGQDPVRRQPPERSGPVVSESAGRLVLRIAPDVERNPRARIDEELRFQASSAEPSS